MPTGNERSIRFTCLRAFRVLLKDIWKADEGFVERRIPCEGNRDRPVILIERQKVLAYLTWSGPSHALGTLDYVTIDGNEVSAEKDGSFRVVVSGERLLPRRASTERRS